MRPALEKAATELDPRPGSRVDVSFDCSCVTNLNDFVGLRSHGHGDLLELLRATFFADGHSEIRKIAFRSGRGVTAIALAHRTFGPDETIRTRSMLLAAIAARVDVVQPPNPPNVVGGSFVGTSDDEEVEVGSGIVWRQWSGLRSSETDPQRAPIELAFESLSELAPDNFRGKYDASYGQLLELLHQRPHTWWVEEQLGRLDAEILKSSATSAP